MPMKRLLTPTTAASRRLIRLLVLVMGHGSSATNSQKNPNQGRVFLEIDFNLIQAVGFRLNQPRPANAEPNNHTAAGTGTAATLQAVCAVVPL